MVYRVYVEKKKELAVECSALLADIRTLPGVSGIEGLRIVNRYDVEDIDAKLFEYAVKTVFSEPQLDESRTQLCANEGDTVFAVEYLPGQFDQRADSAAQCIQIISCAKRPVVRTAKVYILSGNISDETLHAVKKYVINPVESREASQEKPDTLVQTYNVPKTVAVLDGFRKLDRKGLEEFIKAYGLAMDTDDIEFFRNYFISEKRDPTITEIRMTDTYWSDHCRHTTFLTTIDNITFDDEKAARAYSDYIFAREHAHRTKPINLMDMATIAVRTMKIDGKLPKLDESEEINACTVKIKVDVDGEKQDWLLLFKNETHNHPTEIEPFGGAATCIGGAIRDPLSGRAYVYAAMRVTGAADPLKPISETLPGKLPQRKIVTTAAAGYSSYGNQIGLATGQVDEVYHSGYAAKRMEIGAVVGAVPAENVRRERPVAGDKVILLGGRTGRDGCGGATGSSKSHTVKSLDTCGAEVQKGNAPEERKLQRLFRNKNASLLIKRCNDFGAGGVSVAVGELADGLDICLDRVPKKYEGLDGTELAISESQERMAVVVEAKDAQAFIAYANAENIEATEIAVVKEDPRLTMTWNGNTIVDVSREFLDSNGAEKHINIHVQAPAEFGKEIPSDFCKGMKELASDLNVCSKRGLSERFDSTIGAGTVMMPFGGKNQLTPSQAMVHKIPVLHGNTNTCSFMAWGYNPSVTEKDPFSGAYLAVTESVSKLIASGASFEDVYLTFQEYFEKPGKDSERWGKPAAALLGAFEAQKDLCIAAIGGKDSMSGSFEKLDVPPTLVSFAVTTGITSDVISPEFKAQGHSVLLISPDRKENGIPDAVSFRHCCDTVTSLIRSGRAVSAYTPVYGGVAEGIMKMSLGNGIGFEYDASVSKDTVFGYSYGSFILEINDGIVPESKDGVNICVLGSTNISKNISFKEEKVSIKEICGVYEGKLEPVYACNITQTQKEIPTYEYTVQKRVATSIHMARPKVLIPVFPGTNCEYDTARALEKAGAEPEIVVLRNITPSDISESVSYFAKRVKESQIIFIPGGFSGGDEPDGSGKFITAFFRSGAVKDSVNELAVTRGGLMCGICNGFQALIKLGLVPFGEIRDTDAECPTLTFNTIGRHQSRIVRTRVSSDKSPWFAATRTGEIYSVPISHGEGRFIAPDSVIKSLADNGQIITQYVDGEGDVTCDIRFNPNNSVCAIEGISSPDGRIIGKMGHTERYQSGLYANVPGNYDMGLFRSAVEFFK